MTPDFNASLQLFFGDANPAETRVYARWTADSLKAGLQRLQIAGTLSGPFCEYSRTLPATIPFLELGPGQSPLAQAIVPDPCFWTPELPYLYRAHLELRSGSEVLTTCQREFGIRPLGARGRKLYYEGKPWVLRAVRGSSEIEALGEYRAVSAAMLASDLSDESCAAASRRGVLVVANLNSGSAQADSIRRLARHAAVGMIVLGTMPADFDVRLIARNVVFAYRCDTSSMQHPPTWTQALFCDVADTESFHARATHATLPVIAYRPAAAALGIAQRRRLCDLLQRDLAGPHEIAGYVT